MRMRLKCCLIFAGMLFFGERVVGAEKAHGRGHAG